MNSPNRLWKLDVTGSNTYSRRSSTRSSRIGLAIEPNEFTETIKAISSGKLAYYSSKLNSKGNVGKKYYLEESRFNPSLDTPSNLHYSYESHIHDRRIHWSKGFRFGKSNRVLYSKLSELDVNMDNGQEMGSSSRKNSNNGQNMFPSNIEIEVFERKREIRPFSRILASSKRKMKLQKLISYGKIIEDRKVKIKPIGPQSYVLPDPWKKIAEENHQTSRTQQQHQQSQFGSKASRFEHFLGMTTDTETSLMKEISQVESSIVRGSKLSTHSISEGSYQPIRPITRSMLELRKSMTRSSQFNDPRFHHTSAFSKISFASDSNYDNDGDQSTSLDRLNLQSLESEESIHRDNFEDWKYLLASSPILSPAKASDLIKQKSAISDSSQAMQEPLTLDIAKLRIGYDKRSSRNSRRFSSPKSKKSMREEEIYPNHHHHFESHIVLPETISLLKNEMESSYDHAIPPEYSDNIINSNNNQSLEQYQQEEEERGQEEWNDRKENNEDGTISIVSEGISMISSFPKGCSLPSATGNTPLQSNKWKPPIYWSKKLLNTNINTKNDNNIKRNNHGYAMDYLQSNSKFANHKVHQLLRRVHPSTSISSCLVADIMPLKQSTLSMESTTLTSDSNHDSVTCRSSTSAFDLLNRRSIHQYDNHNDNDLNIHQLSQSSSELLDSVTHSSGRR